MFLKLWIPYSYWLIVLARGHNGVQYLHVSLCTTLCLSLYSPLQTPLQSPPRPPAPLCAPMYALPHTYQWFLLAYKWSPPQPKRLLVFNTHGLWPVDHPSEQPPGNPSEQPSKYSSEHPTEYPFEYSSMQLSEHLTGFWLVLTTTNEIIGI